MFDTNPRPVEQRGGCGVRKPSPKMRRRRARAKRGNGAARHHRNVVSREMREAAHGG